MLQCLSCGGNLQARWLDGEFSMHQAAADSQQLACYAFRRDVDLVQTTPARVNQDAKPDTVLPMAGM